MMHHKRIILFIKQLPINYIICFFLLLNVLLRSVFLTAEPISHDEPFTIYFSQFDPTNIIKYLSNYNNPPLYELLLHYWLRLFGDSIYSIRALPVLLSSISVIYLIKIGETFFNRWVALMSACLHTLSTMAMWYSHDCRSYPLFMLLTLMSFYFFFLLLKQAENGYRKYGCYILNTILLLYSHYFGLLVLGLQLVNFIIYYYKYKKQFLQFSISFCIIISAFIPQLITTIQRTSYSVSQGTWIKAPVGIESIYNMLWSFSNEPVPTVICISILIIALIVFVFIYKTKMKNDFTLYAAIWFALPLLGLFFISYKIPVFLSRYLIFILPAYYLLIAICCQSIFKKPNLKIIVSLLVIVCFMFSFSISPSKKRSIPELMEYISLKKNNETAIVVCPFDFILTYAFYHNRQMLKVEDQSSEYDELISKLKQENVYFVNSVSSDFSNTLSSYKNIIYVDAAADFAMPLNNVKETLSLSFKLDKTSSFPEIFTVYEYRHK